MTRNQTLGVYRTVSSGEQITQRLISQTVSMTAFHKRKGTKYSCRVCQVSVEQWERIKRNSCKTLHVNVSGFSKCRCCHYHFL